MMDGEHTALQKIWMELKEETANQLKAVKSEDVDLFVRSIEKCERLMIEIDKLKPSVNSQNELFIEKTAGEIIKIRQGISLLLPEWREKLREHMLREQTGSRVKSAYEEEEYIPPIFLDKKK